jgi:alpha-D-ribose 1-methylphosphonate 5-triphosphate synthase subunit PhnH
MTMLTIDPVWSAEIQQAHFRLLLDAMARPGKCHRFKAVPRQGPSVLAVLASLLDAAVSLADAHAVLREQDWPMLQAGSACAEQADYVLCRGAQPPNVQPKLGTLSSPEQSATLILLVASLQQQPGPDDTHLRLSGPGIKQHQTLAINGLHPGWLSQRKDWTDAFPLGVDIILVDTQQLAAIPRTTHVEVL